MWLIGMMASGKTSAGKLAAARLSVPFFDTDAVVAERMGCSVAQLWGTLGESAFRELEKAATSNLARKDGIVATGGGVVLDEENRRVITRSPKVVWLEASPPVMAARLGSTDERPLLKDSDQPTETIVAERLQERAQLYADTATHRIDTDDMDIEAVAMTIEAIWND